MKQLLVSMSIALFCILGANSLNAQVDLKINPIGALFDNPDISAEFILNENIGIEAKIGLEFGTVRQLGIKFDRQGYSIAPNVRYYFSPEANADKFYAGLYTKILDRSHTVSIGNLIPILEDVAYDQLKVAAGLFLGYKWVSTSGFVLDMNFGGGRAYVNNYTSENSDLNFNLFESIKVDVVGTIAIGYRIGGIKESKKIE